MLAGVIAVLVTLLLGPGMFWFLSHRVYVRSKERKYPTQVNDAFGDTVFLPLYNGVLVTSVMSTHYVLHWITVLVAILFSVVSTAAYIAYQHRAGYTDWSKPRGRFLNAGGWYHASYMVVQTAMIVYGAFHFTTNIWLWAAVAGYLGTTGIQFVRHGYI